jgi:hypothetical protein
MKPTLMILAAGLGSRYGSLKQIDQVGPSGETIIDYSVFDAIRAGFGKVVFVIREDIEADFKEVFQNRFGDKIEVDYVFQDIKNLPGDFVAPADRVKPWGTAHAVMMGANAIQEPFAVINADDYYGADAFKVMADYLSTLEADNATNWCMVGYQLNKTLSEHGLVSRGVCNVNNEKNLVGVTERTKIGWVDGKIMYHDDEDQLVELTGNEQVSMNMWGFTPAFFNYSEEMFTDFLKENIEVPKSEFFIPLVVNNLLEADQIKLKVLESTAEWFGVTYKEDKPVVIKRLENLVEEGVYPKSLWG